MRAANKLTARKVATLTEPGRYGDGGGLWLQVSRIGGRTTKSWLFRFMLAGKARTMGLGSVETFGLRDARERARIARQLVADHIDPIEAKRAKGSAAKLDDAKLVTFGRCVEDYLAEHGAGWKNEKHRDQWESTLTKDAALLRDLPVGAIDTGLVLQVLRPIWRTKPETASRLRGRIERILSWATVSGYRAGENPARWRGHLQEMLPSKSKIRPIKHHAALPYTGIPAFMHDLRARDGISARALELTVLCATRTNETIYACWQEIDFAAKIWTVPAERMKAKREHRVPLTDRALDILAGMPREGEFIFPGGMAGRPLSNMAMLELFKSMKPGLTVHGFRSSFRDWAAEQTNYPREVAEAALAHAIKDKVEAAYARGDLLDKRRRLMRDWSRFCMETPKAAAKVTPIRAAG